MVKQVSTEIKLSDWASSKKSSGDIKLGQKFTVYCLLTDSVLVDALFERVDVRPENKLGRFKREKLEQN